MQKVTGIGGIFFKAANPQALQNWYRDMLGMDVTEWGGVIFDWQEPADMPPGRTIWSILPGDAPNFAPGKAAFMINYRVADVHAMIAELRAKGAAVDDRVEESEFGVFGWVIDPEGNRIELWQPPKQ